MSGVWPQWIIQSSFFEPRNEATPLGPDRAMNRMVGGMRTYVLDAANDHTFWRLDYLHGEGPSRPNPGWSRGSASPGTASMSAY